MLLPTPGFEAIRSWSAANLVEHIIRLFDATSGNLDDFTASSFGDEYKCYINTNPWSPFTMCECKGGNGSADCAQLFADCDAMGGLYSCSEDWGFPSGVCQCEIIF